MTSGGNSFHHFAENQLTKFSARDAGDFSDTAGEQEMAPKCGSLPWDEGDLVGLVQVSWWPWHRVYLETEVLWVQTDKFLFGCTYKLVVMQIHVENNCGACGCMCLFSFISVSVVTG